VKLVGVVNADTAINLPDFRAAERTFQLVSQVAGRCGRGGDGGLALVQTFQPGAPSIRLAAAHEYETFASGELSDRARAGLPPYTRMVRFVVRDLSLAECIRKARELAEQLRGLLTDEMRLRGPAPCPISRIARRHRHQIEITAPTARALQELLAEARTKGWLQLGEELAVDVDPVAMM
jgi:primosomal protein N' (replication factor Y)